MRGFVISNFFFIYCTIAGAYIILLLGPRGTMERGSSVSLSLPSRAFFLPLSPAIFARKIEGLNRAYLFPNFSVPYRSQKPTGRVLQPKKVRSIKLLKSTTGPTCFQTLDSAIHRINHSPEDKY